MTTSSDRILLRWLPLAVLLAAAATVGLTIGPRPFAYHDWPKPIAPRPVERLVRVPTANAPTATWSRASSPAARSAGDAGPQQRHRPVETTPTTRDPAPRAGIPASQPQPVSADGDSGESRRSRGDHGRPAGGDKSPGPGSGTGSGDGSDSGPTLAQAPTPPPPVVSAKPQPVPLPELQPTVHFRLEANPDAGGCGE